MIRSPDSRLWHRPRGPAGAEADPQIETGRHTENCHKKDRDRRSGLCPHQHTPRFLLNRAELNNRTSLPQVTADQTPADPATLAGDEPGQDASAREGSRLPDQEHLGRLAGEEGLERRLHLIEGESVAD